MNDNSTFNSDIFEKAVVSFKNERRLLIKFGKVSKFKLSRYYILQNEFLLYYSSKKCAKSKSSFSLSGCAYIRDSSKVKQLKYSVRVITSNQRKTFWLHPLANEEISLLERYIQFVSEGRFNNDQVIQQLLHEPHSVSKQEKCTSALSSHLQIAFTSYNTTTAHINRPSQQSNQDILPIQKQSYLNNKHNNQMLIEVESESLKSKDNQQNLNYTYNSQMRELEPSNFENYVSDDIHRNKQDNSEQQKFKQGSKQMLIPEQQLENQALINSASLNASNLNKRSDLQGNGQQDTIRDVNQNYRNMPNKQILKQNGIINHYIQGKQDTEQQKQSVSVTGLGQIQLQGQQQMNEYLITLGQMSQNNMFTNQANLSYDNKQSISIDKQNPINISTIFKNMDNHLSQVNFVQESGHFIPNTYKAHSNQDNQGDLIEKDISAIIHMADHSPYLDIDADLKFSSDEEFSNNKNQKLESVRMQYQFHSPCANKDYFIGSNLNSRFQENQVVQENTAQPHTVRAKLFQNYPIDQDNLQGYGIQQQEEEQQQQQELSSSSNNNNHSSTQIFNGINPTSSTNATKNMISPKKFNNHSIRKYNSGTNLQFSNHNQQQQQQQEVKEKSINSGPCNFSSSTLQNIVFPESQKYYTEYLQGSFFTNRMETVSNMFEMNNNNNNNNKNNSNNNFNNNQIGQKQYQFQMGQSQQRNQQKKKEMHDRNEMYYISDSENIQSDDEEQAPSTQFCINQQVFCAGASKVYKEEGFSGYSHQQSQRNSRIGVISNYSFDQKTLSDTDLFEQEEGNFQRSALDMMEEEQIRKQKKKHQKRGSENLSNNKYIKQSISQTTINPPIEINNQQQNQLQQQQQPIQTNQAQGKIELNLKNPFAKTNLRYKVEDYDQQQALNNNKSNNSNNDNSNNDNNKSKSRKNSKKEEDQEMGDDLDDDDSGNPAIANNVTYIIERYKEQNYNDKNSTLFASHNNLVLKTDQSNISEKNRTLSEKNRQPRVLENQQEREIQQKSVNGFRQNAQQSKRFMQHLTVDTEKCNQQYKENEKEIPQIKDKKEFYNKKNIIGQIVPKMEEVLPYLSTEPINDNQKPISKISIEQCYTDGYYYLWSFQFQNAHDIFKIYREENINFEYALLEHNLLKIIVTGNRDLIATTEAKVSEFLEYLLACQKDVQKKGEKSEIKCLKNISKMAINLLKAEIYLIKGLLQAFLNNKFQSFISFKNGYSQFQKVKQRIDSSMTKQQSVDDYLKQEEDKYTQSRYYFISGLFNIGLAMIPSYFLKILSLIGVQPNKSYGYECLEKCIALQSTRSSYASLLLCIEYIELNPILEKSIQLIKKMIKNLPQCPLFYWMASLLSWRYAKPDEALNLINKSLWNCGEKLGDIAFYLKFEKGWYNVSQFDWKSALVLFEEIVVMAMDIDNFDMNALCSIAQQKKISPQIPKLMLEFIDKSKQKYQTKYKIILPHKCCLAALIACCYENQGNIEQTNLWLLMTSYLLKKHGEGKTGVDEDIQKLCSKYINRENKQFVKYEILYFVKEITKLRDDMLTKMVDEIEFYYQSEYSSIQDIFYKKIFKNNTQKSIDFGSTIFLRIVAGCLQQNLQMVYSSGKIVDKIAEFIPSDHLYILHHSYHWLARCQMQQNLFAEAKENLKKCLKYKKCEFTLENKSQKLLQQIDFAK